MRGSIQQRGAKSWRVRVYVGRDSIGKPRYVEKAVSGSRREAERELSRVLTDAEEGRYSPSAAMSLNHLLDRWLDVKAISIEPSTLNSYQWIADHYVRPALGDRKVGKLRPLDLDMLYADLSARGLSPRTVRICHSILRQSLEQARRWGLIARSPAVDSTPIPQRHKEVIPPTVQEVARILDAAMAEDPEFGLYLWVLAATGCRRGEGCALRWTDIDLERAELRIRRSIAHVGTEIKEKDTKTHASRRMAIDPATIDLLRQHRLRQRERYLALGIRMPEDAALFADAEGQPWRPDVCTNRFGRLRAQLGLKGVRLHDLRHFVATVLTDGGIPIGTVSKRLGHSQLSTTLDLYTHAIPATDQRAAAYIGEVLTRRPGTPGARTR